MNPGARVCYLAAYLATFGAAEDDFASVPGTVEFITPIGEMVFAWVKWDDGCAHQVNVNNLVEVDL